MALSNARSIADLAKTETYAFHPVASDLEGEIKSFSALANGNPGDIFIYHSSFGIPEITHLLRRRNERLVLVYHNVTPADYYWDISPEFAASLEWGRHELSLIRSQVAVAVSDSEFNARELTALGYQNVEVIPAGIDPFRLRDVPSDETLAHELAQQFPAGFLLCVSQVLPHKRVEIALEVTHLLRSVHNLEVGLVVAGPQRNFRYAEIVNRYSRLLPDADVLFLGEVTVSQLATLYRRAAVLLGTSDHEGLGIPPLEAMAEECPVVVRGSGAVPETVGDAALVIDPSWGVLDIVEVVAELIQNNELNRHFTKLGLSRVRELQKAAEGKTFRRIIEGLLR